MGRAPVSTGVGYNGLSENRKGKLGNVTIGGISVDTPDATFFGQGTGRDKKIWGIKIGNAFLKDFIVTIDYRGKLVDTRKALAVSEKRRFSPKSKSFTSQCQT